MQQLNIFGWCIIYYSILCNDLKLDHWLFLSTIIHIKYIYICIFFYSFFILYLFFNFPEL